MRIVIALGGNALGDSPAEQLELVKHTAESIVDLVNANHEIVLVHGNGPQVGMIIKSFESGSERNETPEMPMPECGAMSQGYIGYHLQNAVKNLLKKKEMDVKVATLITQTVVEKNDSAFQNPTKPIGKFYSYEESLEKSKEKGVTMVEDSGRGYRVVVPSPKPINIVEKETIIDLLESNTVVIAGGGGGIPVIETHDGFVGVPAVIDKDSTAAKLAKVIDADTFIILTAVSTVMINFGKPNQEAILKMNLIEAQKHIDNKQFPPGSMLPKVEAAMEFVKSKPNSQALIASLEEVSLALKGQTGTIIYY